MTDRRFHYVMGGLTLALIVLAFLICGSALFDENFPSGLLKMRLARVLLGIVAGTSLSIAGVILQATLRNPLAEPYLIGVSSGGGLGASIAILLGLSAFGVWTLPLAAFCGSFCTVLIVLVLAGRLTAFSPATLLLGGVAVSSAAGGVLGILISLSNHETLRSISWWLMGGLQITDQSLLLVVTLVTLLALPFAFMLARDLDAMALGDSFAHALGVSLKRRRLGALLLTALLTGSAVSACGLIGFVGLIVPHLTRELVGAGHKRLLPASALGGAVFLLMADLLARRVLKSYLGPTELPIGAVTAILGGLFFLRLLLRKKTPFLS